MFEFHDADGAGCHAFAALDAVGVEIARPAAAAVVGRELHGAHPGAALALHLAGGGHADVGETAGQRGLSGRNPGREGAHGAEGAPGPRCVDEREEDAYDGGDQYDGPENPSHGVPVAPGEIHLHAEHREDEHHHEQTEAECANEFRNRAVGRVSGQHPVVEIAARAGVPAPPPSASDGESHRRYHANERQQSDDGVEESYYEVGRQYPVEGVTLGGKVSVKSFRFHVYLSFSAAKVPTRKSIDKRFSLSLH